MTTTDHTFPAPSSLNEEGTWWWELSLPRSACREQIDARYLELLASRKNADDIYRLHRAYSVATHETSLPTPAALGLPPLLRIDDLARSGLHLSRVSSHDIVVAKANIQDAIWTLRRLSSSLNAFASDDAFGEPNAADMVIEELESALTALGGRG